MSKLSKSKISNVVIVLFLVIILVGTLGCTSSNVVDFKRYVGTEGMTITFMKDAPTAEVYENRPFPVRVQIQNKGAQDVNYSNMRITFTKDPLYISGGLLFYDLRTYDQESTKVEGKSLAYRNGETKEFGIPGDVSFLAKPILGQRLSPKTDLVASVCYLYTTTLTSDVCIDVSTYNQNVRAQPCKQANLAIMGGQGAPISISKVEVRAIPIYDSRTKIEAVRPEFYIEMQNVGGGSLIGPNTLSLENACLLKGISSGEINAVNVEAWLLSTKLNCGPDRTKNNGITQLPNNAGSIVCTVPEDQMSQAIYTASQNFQTVLTINVSYIYKSSIKQEVSIVRTPGNTEPTYPLWMFGKRSGYMYLSDVKGSMPTGFSEGPTPDLPQGTAADAGGTAPKAETPINNDKGEQASKCEYFAKDPTQAPAGAKQITSAYQCACSREQCLTSGGKCIFGFCPGESYCCTLNRGTTANFDNIKPGSAGNLDSWKDLIVASSCNVGVYPSIVAAQFQLESGGGANMPANSNNPFGVKCGSSSSCTVPVTTTECVGTNCGSIKDSFKVYPSLSDAIAEHAAILMGKKSGLSSVITKPFSSAVNSRNYDAAIQSLQGTYATDPEYASKLQSVISSKNLRSWDTCIN